MARKPSSLGSNDQPSPSGRAGAGFASCGLMTAGIPGVYHDLECDMAATDRTARHLELLIDTIAAVNSSLDLDEVFQQIASRVADALDTDACFVYIYDERTDTLELRATHGTRFDDPAHRPRMHLGEGI